MKVVVSSGKSDDIKVVARKKSPGFPTVVGFEDFINEITDKIEVQPEALVVEIHLINGTKLLIKGKKNDKKEPCFVFEVSFLDESRPSKIISRHLVTISGVKKNEGKGFSIKRRIKQIFTK